MCRRSSLLIAVLLAACDRPETLVLCHNGNCAGDANPADDDTPEALKASLALEVDGRPAIDGVELDTLWQRSSGKCLFEHGPGEILADDEVFEAGEAIAEHLEGNDVAWNGDRFYVIIEMKGYVGRRSEVHTEAEQDLHADCVLDLFEQLVAAAAGRHKLQIVFDSPQPELLDAVVANPRFPGRLDGDVEVRLAAEAGGPLGPLIGRPPLADYAVPLDIIEYQSDDVTAAQMEAYASMDVDLCMGSYSTTREALQSIVEHEPAYVLTGEAALLRGWLED
jgi:hypothetical protein